MEIKLNPDEIMGVLHAIRNRCTDPTEREVLQSFIDQTAQLNVQNEPEPEKTVEVKVTRDAGTGLFVSKDEAKARPKETVTETVERRVPRH
jgi:hypothetical protein